MNLSDKTAIVTGASSGLGAAFSKALVAKGTTVYGLARDKKELQNVHKKLGKLFIPVTLDVTHHGEINQWISSTFDENQPPDLLINNAGLGLFGDVDQLTLDEWHTMIDTNISGVFYMTRQIVPLMKQKETPSHIINIASIAGKVGNPKMSGYNATKFGVRGFSEALFQELRYEGIKVTCFYPGSTQTNFFDHAEGVEAHSNMLQPDDVANTLVHVVETPDNFLINEVVMRPLNPKFPESK